METIKQYLDLLEIKYEPYQNGIIIVDFPEGTYNLIIRNLEVEPLPISVFNTDIGIIIKPNVR